MRKTILTAIVGSLIAQPVPGMARNILITNDDGLTSNVVALYEALKADGHDVVVAVPCRNQSGMGAALEISRPIAVLTEPCRNDAAPTGAPGVGAMTREGVAAGDFYYADATPVMAMAYGVDVVAQARWGAAPDLVLSGPNEGQNVGAIILSSGTVSAAQAAAIRGLPAISLSAGGGTEGDVTLANADSVKVAELSAILVRKLDTLAGSAPMLPRGMALNVNFPDQLENAQWRATRIGTYNAYSLRFVPDMAAAATPIMEELARIQGAKVPNLPGLSFAMNTQEPSASERDDESVVIRNAITVSAMQAGYEVKAFEGWNNWLVKRLASD